MPGVSLQNPRTLRHCRSTPSAVLQVPCPMRAMPMASGQNLDQSRWSLLSLYVGNGATQISSHRGARFVWRGGWRSGASRIRMRQRPCRFQKPVTGRPDGASRSRTLGQAHMPIAYVRQASRAIRQKVLLQGAWPDAPLQLSQNGDTRCHNHPTC